MLRLKKASVGTKIVFGVVFILFVFYALAILYALFFCLNASLKDGGRQFIADNVSLSRPPKFRNYVDAFSALTLGETTFFGMLGNSVWYALGNAFFNIASSCLAAYVVCKYKFFGRNFLYGLVLVVMMIPIYGALPAKYRMLHKLGMIDSPLILLSAAGGFDFSFLIIYAFFKNVPWSYAEAAFIDGASHTKVFFKIMLPMALPAISAIFVTNFIGNWNNYDAPLLFLSNMPTLASGLFVYERKIQYLANQPIYFAGVIISLIPILIIFAVFQNSIMQNVYAGGLKG